MGLCASVCARNVCVPSVCACVCICRGVVLVCVMYKGVKAKAGNRFQNEAAVFSLHKKGSKRGRSRGEEYLSKRDKGTSRSLMYFAKDCKNSFFPISSAVINPKFLLPMEYFSSLGKKP